MAKDVEKKDGPIKLRLHIPAGKAQPSPPIGPALGQRGVKIMDFCKAFNDACKGITQGTPIPVTILIKKDKSFTFTMGKPTMTHLIKEKAKIKKCSSKPGLSLVGKISMQDVEEIAKEKMSDLRANSIEAAMHTVIGSARSMGLEVI